MDAMDFDALVYSNQGFNTMEHLVNSDVTPNMSQQTLQNIQTMQTQMPQGHTPQHVVLPVFQKQAQQQKEQQKNNNLQFYVAINNVQKGPFSLEQLKGLAMADIIDEDTQVWQTGTPAWTDLKTCLINLKI